ncbi:hypothetical protein BT63DRAFT_417335 [Microthyrium microscopicum]|uniref:Mediator of RNA polymerase II transcription subunit 17 n=1 Tax=Microthyrium microscopicum TaxID=703497 RepID=A0A6A6U1M7_9PEZI|nr:hypothetical protein BT63DRAFT_417335 [Microthyrium microscopicum]
MADSSTLTVSLRPSLKDKAGKPDLSAGIRRMLEQYGSFRKITEQGLRDATIEAESAMETDNIDHDSSKPEQDKGTVEYLHAKKGEMIQSLEHAWHSAAVALDFVSIIHSKREPKFGETSMSQAAKDMIPLGSLDYDKWPVYEPSKKKLALERKVTEGGKIVAMASAADNLLRAANRLHQDVKREATYWEHVLSIQENDWTVFRNPQYKKQLAVQTAALEAGPQFIQRGKVILQPDSEGTITLKHQTATKPKMIQVRIRQPFGIAGISTGFSIPVDGDLSLEDQLKQSQTSLAEEELFHEMTVECRSLSSLGIDFVDDSIVVPISSIESGPPEEILIDLVTQEQSMRPVDSTLYNDMAEGIALSLRLLLANYHRRILRRRTSVPPPIGQPRPEIKSQILRTLMQHLSHIRATKKLSDSLARLTTVVTNAGLPINFGLIDPAPKPEAESLIRIPLDRQEAKYSLQLASASLLSDKSSKKTYAIEIHAITSVSGQPFGTEYRIRLPTSITSLVFPQAHGAAYELRINDLHDLILSVGEYLCLDIVHNILAVAHTKWATNGSDCWLELHRGDRSPVNIAVRFMNRDVRDWTLVGDHLELEVCRTGDNSLLAEPQESDFDTPVDKVNWGMGVEGGKTTLVETVGGWIEETEAKENKDS